MVVGEASARSFLSKQSGACTDLGTELALKAAPDGGTLLLAMSSNAINPALYHHLKFNFIRDAVPVASIATIRWSWMSIRRCRAKTASDSSPMSEPIRARSTCASGGNGTPLYVAGALFR